MTTTRVPVDQLVENDPHWPFADVTLKGAPFTGIAVERLAHSTREVTFVDGMGNGPGVVTADNGQVLEQFTLAQGVYVGDSRSWFPDGTPRSRIKHGHPRSEERFNQHGQLVESYDEASATRFRWYDDNVLRSETRGETTREFTRAGVYAFSWKPRSRSSSTIYEGMTFENEVMFGALRELSADWSREHQLFAWVKWLLDTNRGSAVDALEALLSQPNLYVVSTAISFIGNTGVTELHDRVRGFFDDPRLPPTQWEDGRGRSASRSLGEVARAAIEEFVDVRCR